MHNSSQSPLDELLQDGSDMPDISAKQFLLKTLLWLPLCFVIWYGAANIFSFPAIRLSDLLLPWILPGVMDGVDQQGYIVNIVTKIMVTADNGQTGDVILSFNALKYGYGFPLIVAMMLATPYSIFDKLDDMTYGLIIVSLTQCWGICFEAISTLLLKTGPEITSQVNQILPFTENSTFLNFIALGYQLGFLVLPAVVPIVFWIMRHQNLLEKLAEK